MPSLPTAHAFPQVKFATREMFRMFVAIHGRKAIYMIGAILHDRLTNSRFEMQNLFADYVLAEISKFGIEDLPVDLKRLRGTTSQAALVGLVRGYGV